MPTDGILTLYFTEDQEHQGESPYVVLSVAGRTNDQQGKRQRQYS